MSSQKPNLPFVPNLPFRTVGPKKSDPPVKPTGPNGEPLEPAKPRKTPPKPDTKK